MGLIIYKETEKCFIWNIHISITIACSLIKNTEIMIFSFHLDAISKDNKMKASHSSIVLDFYVVPYHAAC